MMLSGVVYAYPVSQQKALSHLYDELAESRTPKDSIRILYNIFDISTRQQQKTVGRKLFETARRANDYSTCMDIIRLVSNTYEDKPTFDALIAETEKMPQSKERDETIVFLKMKRLIYDISFMKEEARQKAIVEILASHDTYQGDPADRNKAQTDSNSVHQKLLQLFTLVQYLRNEATGDMLKEYFDQLNDLMIKSNVDLYTIHNLVNTEAAKIYSDAGDYQKANDANRKMLKVIEDLEDKYAKMGRNYRNYDWSRYVIYLRMMRNFEDLSNDDIEDIYEKTLELAARNSEIEEDLNTSAKFYAYHDLAVGDYKSAIPRLKSILVNDKITLPERKHTLEYLIRAAEKTGDVQTKIEALTEYNTILDELNRTNAADKYKELQIKYDVESLKAQNANLELENKEDDIRSSRRIMTFVLVAFIVVAIALFLSLMNWGRFRNNSTRMGHVVDRFTNERRRLRNTIYYDYATHAPLDEEDDDETVRQHWKRVLKEKGIKDEGLSMFMTESIVNDLIYIASFGRDTRRKFIHEYSVDTLLRKIQHQTNEACESHGVLKIEAPEDDFKMVTDGECLIDILSHILINAVKASPVRTVDLTARKGSRGQVDFIFSIAGLPVANPGDPHMLEDFISDRNILERKEAGLFICRMISLLLKSNHYPDTTYTHGARYVITFPENMIE